MVREVFSRWKRVHRRPSMEQEVLLLQEMRFGRRKQSDKCRRGRGQSQLCAKSWQIQQESDHHRNHHCCNLYYHRTTIMKVNDIIEREFDGNVFRFQITELRPRVASIVVLDDTLPFFERDISSRLSPIFTNYMFAIIENDGFVTTKEGDDTIEILTVEMYKRIQNWCFTLLWVDSNTSLNKDEAKCMVAKLNARLHPRFHSRYLPAVVRWACNGEIDPDDNSDIKRMRRILTSFHLHLSRRTRENIARFGYKVEFVDSGFKRINVDGTETLLEKMEETEYALRHWLYL